MGTFTRRPDITDKHAGEADKNETTKDNNEVQCVA